MGPQTSFSKSFYYAFEGIKTAFKEEPNFKIHTGIAILTLLLAAFLGFSTTEWLLLLFTISFVLVVELINTSLEDILNLVNPETHPLVKKAKDVMAAAVLLSVVISVIVGVALILPKLLTLFK
jgi:diacylglycerol kinase